MIYVNLHLGFKCQAFEMRTDSLSLGSNSTRVVVTGAKSLEKICEILLSSSSSGKRTSKQKTLPALFFSLLITALVF